MEEMYVVVIEVNFICICSFSRPRTSWFVKNELGRVEEVIMCLYLDYAAQFKQKVHCIGPYFIIMREHRIKLYDISASKRRFWPRDDQMGPIRRRRPR